MANCGDCDSFSDECAACLRLGIGQLRETLRGLLECFDGFGSESDDGRVMNATMPWDEVVPRVKAARSLVSGSDT